MTLRQRLDQLRQLAVACTQQHHQELIPLFQPHVPLGGTVIDVGAHAGQFAKLFSRMVGPKGRVHAFEPSPYTRSILETALRVNRCGNVVVHAEGLSDKPGVLTLHTPIKRSGVRGFGLASMGGVGGQELQGEVAETVDVLTLDSFASTQGLHVDFIKADIEGWEAHLLRGAERVLATDHPALFLEIDHHLLSRAGEDAAALFGRLSALGYRARKLGGSDTVTSYDGPGDYLFVA
jgi:FkbM family methyltransferase